MQRSTYDDYLRRFNAADPDAFHAYMDESILMTNGAMHLKGIGAVREHYTRHIWPFFEETVHVERFVTDESTLAVRLRTRFVARADADTVFGRVARGDGFQYRGVVLYEIVGGRFTRIDVAYSEFVRIDADGARTMLGMPH